MKLRKREALRKLYTCKKAVYENAKILDPDGHVLCHTEMKKANWYLLKGLATLERQTEDELVVKLNFEPNREKDANKSVEDDAFYV